MYVPIVSYTFYLDEYRAGSPDASISPENWPFMERRAWTELNRNKRPFDPLYLPQGIKLAVCALAEYLFLQIDPAPSAGDVISEKNFQTSWTIKDSKHQEEADKEIISLLERYLTIGEMFIWHHIFRGLPREGLI